jgi:predicted RNase H-like nuclease (RuvC/YqgF family)
MTTPAPSTLKQAPDLIQRIISNLTDYGDQVGKIDDLKAEQQKAQAKLDQTKQQLKDWQQEVKETTYYRDKYLAEARDKAAECERLDKEIKEKRVVVSQLNEWINKIRQHLG